MLKIGVLGAGHLGKIHLKCLQGLEGEFHLSGFFDIDVKTAVGVSQRLGVQCFKNIEKLLDEVDVVDVVTPTTTHFALASQAIKSGKHVFVEKPVTQTPEEAKQLIELAKKHRVTAQVGHVERFNPAMLAVKNIALDPMFVEAHRLATFNPRGTDVPVVLDLMIHDIDIVLSLVKSPIRSIHASGVPVVSDSPDIANARLEFENGCVANLTASRISMKQMRKVRLFQRDAYLGLDFLKKESQVIRLSEKTGDGELPPASFEIQTPNGTKILSMEMPPAVQVNAIQEELKAFAAAIKNGEAPVVSLEEGYEALRVAWAVMAQISERLDKKRGAI
ncbi:MAG TPA: Gfo/Idh/MocA family oxidoreductase [Bacteroidetes bacterium]|nr:Gfo/Idh/MocA family oxidoreductase [Bacteroidota bacterium]